MPTRFRSRRACSSALVLVMMRAMDLIIIVTSILRYSLNERRFNYREAMCLEARNGSEAMAKSGLAPVRQRMETRSDFTPPASPPTRATSPPRHLLIRQQCPGHRPPLRPLPKHLRRRFPHLHRPGHRRQDRPSPHHVAHRPRARPHHRDRSRRPLPRLPADRHRTGSSRPAHSQHQQPHAQRHHHQSHRPLQRHPRAPHRHPQAQPDDQSAPQLPRFRRQPQRHQSLPPRLITSSNST